MSFGPDFSPLASRYVRARPRYPPELFVWLAGLVDRHELAWDCATGNGQAAVRLTPHFDRVIATDVSSEQLRHALADPRIDYRVAPAEASGLEERSIDLVTIAAAAHWVDLDGFSHEVVRVTRPGGALAAFTYHLAIVSAPFDAAFGWLYWEILKPYFSAATKLVDDRYAALALPGDPIAAPAFEVTAEWRLDEALAFVGTWSGSAAFQKATGHDPAELVRSRLEAIYGDRERAHTLRWPLFVRAQRIR